MSSKRFIPVMALVLTSCGGGAGGETYCLTVSPAIFNFECEGGTTTVEFSNSCGVEVTVSAPVVEESCADRVTITPAEEGQVAVDGGTVAYQITYTPVGSEVWDCQIQFPHDLSSEAAPVVSLAGGSTSCTSE